MFHQITPCPINLQRKGSNEQICFVNNGEIECLPRGTIFGVSRLSLDKYRTLTHEGPQYLQPPFDILGVSNFHLLREPIIGPQLFSAPGTRMARKGTTCFLLHDGTKQSVSIWQCIPNTKASECYPEKIPQ